MTDFLLEIFTEEIPAKAQAHAEEQLVQIVTSFWAQHSLSYDLLETFSTPRRLGVSITGLPREQISRSVELKGPKVSLPVAVEGFLTSNGLKRVDCVEKPTPDGKDAYLFATKIIPGRATQSLIIDLVTNILTHMEWSKTMRWGSHSFPWSRPVRRLLVLSEAQVVPFTFEPWNLTAVGSTTGHRFLSPHLFEVRGFQDYKKKLFDNYVVLQGSARRARILDQIHSLLTPKNLCLMPDEPLINDLVGLVEWPVTLLGRIDDLFMALPPEVLVTSMRHHQKFLSVTHKDGTLAPYFLIVSNMETVDQNAQILEGNERILRARLSDAQFFYDQDRKCDLDAWNAPLGQRLFHVELGSMADKVRRLQDLTERLGSLFPSVSADDRRTAVRLLKADLSTSMVGEFPELQGVMGSFYARNSGYGENVAQAIRDHYLPSGLSDISPTSPLSVFMALVDRLDTLVGFFSINQAPSSSKDPYGLRRAALGIMRLLIDHRLDVSLRHLVESAVDTYGMTDVDKKEILLEKIMGFLRERFKFLMKPQFSTTHVQGVVKDSEPCSSWESRVWRDVTLLQALKDTMETPQGRSLVDLYKRVTNITAHILDHAPLSDIIDTTLLTPPEKALVDQLECVQAEVERLLQTSPASYPAILQSLLTLSEPLATFFENVLVNVEDPFLRQNRLVVLQRIRDLFLRVIDLKGF